MKVELTNIQSIKHAVYEIEEKGVTQIIGENSNGKSIFIKACSFIANNKIKDEDKRDSIINDDVTHGIITMEREGVTLKATIYRESTNCVYELKRKDGTLIRRTIREGGLEELTEEFGWIAFDGNICLQIFETFGIMPFVNNRESSDYEIVDYIITDRVANDFVENYSKVTHPAFKDYLAKVKSKAEEAQRILDKITFYPIDKYEDILFKLKKYQRNVQHLKIVNPIKLPITKHFNYVPIEPIKLNRMPIYKIAPDCPNMVSLISYIKDYSEALNGFCPTCHTKFKEMEN
jgi:energy-coupling factor transporter ATP-binding protein EcfA2